MSRFVRLACWIFLGALSIGSIAILLLIAFAGLASNPAMRLLVGHEVSLVLGGIIWLIPVAAGVWANAGWWTWPQPGALKAFNFILLIQTAGIVILSATSRESPMALFWLTELLVWWFGATAAVLWSLLAIAWLRRSKGKDSHGESAQPPV